MFDLKENLHEWGKIRKVPQSTDYYGPNKTRIKDIKTYGEGQQTAQIWLEGKLGDSQVSLFLSTLFGQFIAEYTSRNIISDVNQKDETEITLPRIPTVVVYGKA